MRLWRCSPEARRSTVESFLHPWIARMTPDLNALTDSERAELDARLAAQAPAGGWDRFYADRAKPCPFFVGHPDENLARWVREGRIAPGRAVDLGCGHGRNAVFLARQGFSVDALDASAQALAWARERVDEALVPVTLIHADVFAWAPEPAAYDLVYDSGCFHHIAPHRRADYVQLVARALRPGGFFGLTCFRPEGGSGYSDEEVYQRNSLGGGLGYTEQRLAEIWSSSGLQIEDLRQMRKPAAGEALFGEDFLWVLLARKG